MSPPLQAEAKHRPGSLFELQAGFHTCLVPVKPAASREEQAGTWLLKHDGHAHRWNCNVS